LEIALGTEIADSKSKNREFVEFRDDVLFKRQKTGQVIKFRVETFAVSFAWVAFRRVLHRRFHTKTIFTLFLSIWRVKVLSVYQLRCKMFWQWSLFILGVKIKNN